MILYMAITYIVDIFIDTVMAIWMKLIIDIIIDIIIVRRREKIEYC